MVSGRHKKPGASAGPTAPPLTRKREPLGQANFVPRRVDFARISAMLFYRINHHRARSRNVSPSSNLFRWDQTGRIAVSSANDIRIDAHHARAICAEVGERLRFSKHESATLSPR